MLQNSWRDRITKEEVFQKVGERNTVRKIIQHRTTLIKHVVRHDDLFKTLETRPVEVQGKSHAADIA